MHGALITLLNEHPYGMSLLVRDVTLHVCKKHISKPQHHLPFITNNSPVSSLPLHHKKEGVLIAVKNTVGFSLHESICDPEGKYLILTCDINNRPFTVVNASTANSHQIRFAHKLSCKISKVKRGSLVICRDINLTANPHLDLSSKP